MRDQKGFTLVELLIGIVILSIVTAAVCSFIIIGSKSYAAANTEIMLQQEAQLALNQISDVVIDTTRSVNYAGYDESGTPVLAVKDADFTFEPQYKSLALFNGASSLKYDENGKPIPVLDEAGNPKVDSEGNPVYEMNIETGSGNQKNYQFYWDKPNAILYYSETDDVTKEVFPGVGEENCVVLAEYVTEFSVDLTQVEEKRVVQVSMTFERDNKTYHTSNNITIRNKVRVNDADLKQLDKRVKLSVVPKENSVILEPGETYQFSTPLVSGQNVMDKSVTWSLSTETPPDDSTTQFTDMTNGIIHIATGETVDSFKVVITTNAKDSEGKQATAEVIVYVKRAKTVALSLDGGSQEISVGTNFTINASVEGNKLGFSCGGCTDATTIDKYVIADEPLYQADTWKVISGAEFVDMIDCDNKSASFKVNANAQDGDTVVIQAASLLSAVKKYDNGSGIVYGTITLTVKGKAPIHVEWDGNLLYGVPKVINPQGMSSDDPVFFVCVRIKEDPNAPVEQDKVMIYTTEGNNATVMPDIWLLDMNKKYYVTVQLINILSDPDLRDENNQKTEKYNKLRSYISAWSGSGNTPQKPEGEAYDELVKYTEEEFWPEYEKNINQATGYYTGTKYPDYSNLLQGVVEKPRIGIKSYLNDEISYDGVDAKTIYTVQKGSLDIKCEIRGVTSTSPDNVQMNSTYYDVYKGTGDYTEWKPLMYGVVDYDKYYEEKPSYVGTEGVDMLGGSNGQINGILKFVDLANYVNSGMQIDFTTNNDSTYGYGKKKQLVGNYHYVPAFMYQNRFRDVYLKVHNYDKLYTGKQYCYDYNSTFNFEIKDGGNFETKVWAYTDDGFQKGEIFFPVPSDTKQFPKQFRNSGSEEVSMGSYEGTYLLDDNGKLHNLKFSDVRCRYNEAQNRYELKLYYDCMDNVWNVAKKCYAGTFICAPDGNEWRLFEGGAFDEYLEAGKADSIVISASNADIILKDGNGNPQKIRAYIALPSSTTFTQPWYGGFGFVLGQEGEQVCKNGGVGIKYQFNGDAQVKWADCSPIICNYDKSTDTYTLQLTVSHKEWSGNLNQEVSMTDTVTVACKSNGTEWTIVN